MKLRKIITAVTAAAMLFSAGNVFPQEPVSAAENITFSGITGLPFENGDPFKGVDVSSVIALEQSGVKFFDRAGKEQDIFVTLAEAGVNTVRIRIWNDPTASGSHQTYGGGANDAAQAEKIAKRCADAGLKLLLDFHYSDFWADPAKQRAPKAWEHYSVQQKASAIYDYTTETMKKIKATGADIAMVQIGNETTSGMCGVHLDDGNWGDGIWADLASLWNAGSKAVRDFDRSILVGLHFTNPEKTSNMMYLAKMLAQNHVDYDVFATSYYPYWHGTLSNLRTVLGNIASEYHKKVLVAETSWAYNYENTDAGGNTIGSPDQLGNYVSYPVSPEGQTAFLQDLFRTVAMIPDGAGIGVFYWEPAWLGIGGNTQNADSLRAQYGGGWATEAAMEYDPDAKYFGGSAVENQALFDQYGKPLDSLYVFGTVTGGGTKSSGEQRGKNLIENPGFERDGGWSDHPAGWELHGTADSHFDVRAEDVRSGGYALHWYSEQAFSGSSASTAVQVSETGRFCGYITLQADESTQFRLTLTTSGGKSETVEGSGAGWAVWQTPEAVIDAAAGETVTMTVTISGGAGAYGSIDDCGIALLEQEAVTTTTEATTTAAAATTTEETTTVTETATTAESTATTETTAVTTTETTPDDTETTEPQPQRLRGDADCSGEVDVSDAVLTARIIAEDQEAVITEAGKKNADCDRDGRIAGNDVTAILRIIARLE